MNITQIICNNNRKVLEIDVKKKMASIKAHGLLTPIGVNKNNQVVYGRIRFEALKRLKITNLIENEHYRIVEHEDDEIIAFIENDNRKNLSLSEEINAIFALYEKYKNTSLVAEKLNYPVKWVAIRLKLKDLSDRWKKILIENEFPKWKLSFFSEIAQLPKDIQDSLIYHFDNNDKLSEIKDLVSKEAMWKIADFDFDGCGKCHLCIGKQDYLFDEYRKSGLCADISYKNKKLSEIREGFSGKLVSTSYTCDDEVYDKYDYDEDETGEEALNIETGKIVKVKFNKRTPEKKARKTLAEKKAAKEIQRNKLVISKIANMDVKFNKKHVGPLLLFLGLSPQNKGTFNTETYETEYLKGFSKGFYGILDFFKEENKDSVKELNSLTINELKKRLFMELERSDDYEKSFELLEFLYKIKIKDIMEEVMIELPDPKSWKKEENNE